MCFCILHSLIHSYKTVMQQCWHGNPDQRPTFSQLRTQIDTLITEMAGYMEFSMIPPCVELDQVHISINMFTCEKQLHNRAVVSVLDCKWQRLPIQFLFLFYRMPIQCRLKGIHKTRHLVRRWSYQVCVDKTAPLWKGKSPSYLGSANN